MLGAGQWRGTPATIWRNVLPSFVYRALKGMPLRLDNGGDASRDFIYVEDIARGLIACAERGAAGDVYNLASGDETTILELATAINALAGDRSELQVAPRREWDRSGKRFGSPAKSVRELGFRVQVPLSEGLPRTVEWTRAHLDEIDACVARHAAHLEGEHAVAR
jgi:UDP-glucose 4-epimerase